MPLDQIWEIYSRTHAHTRQHVQVSPSNSPCSVRHRFNEWAPSTQSTCQLPSAARHCCGWRKVIVFFVFLFFFCRAFSEHEEAFLTVKIHELPRTWRTERDKPLNWGDETNGPKRRGMYIHPSGAVAELTAKNHHWTAFTKSHQD